MASHGSSPKLKSPDSRDQSETRRLAEADVDPSGELTPNPKRGEPAESRETPVRGDKPGSPTRESETAPNSGEQE